MRDDCRLSHAPPLAFIAAPTLGADTPTGLPTIKVFTTGARFKARERIGSS